MRGIINIILGLATRSVAEIPPCKLVGMTGGAWRMPVYESV